MNKKIFIGERSSTVPPRGGVVIGNVKTTREFININGDVIDPRTKQIIKKNVEEKLIIN